jgi:hypothetical protein
MPWPLWRTKSAEERAKSRRDKTREDKAKMQALLATNPSARYPSTQVSYADPSFAEPPPLNYSLRPRLRAIGFFWSLVFIDCVCVPIILYFTLWYLTKLSPNAGMSVWKMQMEADDYSVQHKHRGSRNSLHGGVLPALLSVMEAQL